LKIIPNNKDPPAFERSSSLFWKHHLTHCNTYLKNCQLYKSWIRVSNMSKKDQELTKLQLVLQQCLFVTTTTTTTTTIFNRGNQVTAPTYTTI
jgi:hypothetical protein